ncbi:DUF2268 domain-containing protein [Neobacillus jeddahensis]|uniref:DUF2268 domain-containing protein n=1 Tax=Neobacillus jeddahensis TaxID=1461580 RepID=UPI00058CDF9A|nr:DUF2268 domain-containing protein [Neobacillus jeddahensis]
MGVIRTDRWLDEEFDKPIKICEKLRPYFKGQSANEIYHELLNFGMYRPSRSSRKNVQMMLEKKVWEQVDRLYSKYKSKWNGPDIPIFLFPVAQTGDFFMREKKSKAGVSYPDKMFLFLSYYEDPKEMEALLVHEYHHVCRMNRLAKKIDDYTLLDSIIIEGLAEYAVLKNCGRTYLANWCTLYSEDEISTFWTRFLKTQLDTKKSEREHDELLFGGGSVPKLLGYAVGYHLIRKFYENHQYSTRLSFTKPASSYIE